MAWMLQPHNWTQAIRPNLYNVAYRRNDAYKGMGWLGKGGNGGGGGGAPSGGGGGMPGGGGGTPTPPPKGSTIVSVTDLFPTTGLYAGPSLPYSVIYYPAGQVASTQTTTAAPPEWLLWMLAGGAALWALKGGRG